MWTVLCIWSYWTHDEPLPFKVHYSSLNNLSILGQRGTLVIVIPIIPIHCRCHNIVLWMRTTSGSTFTSGNYHEYTCISSITVQFWKLRGSILLALCEGIHWWIQDSTQKRPPIRKTSQCHVVTEFRSLRISNPNYQIPENLTYIDEAKQYQSKEISGISSHLHSSISHIWNIQKEM